MQPEKHIPNNKRLQIITQVNISWSSEPGPGTSSELPRAPAPGRSRPCRGLYPSLFPTERCESEPDLMPKQVAHLNED